MTSVMRPAGPLPAKVYWVRRALLVVVLVVLLSLVWWTVGRVFGGGSGAGAATDSPGSGGGQDGGSVSSPPHQVGNGGNGGNGGTGSGHHGRKHHRQHHRPQLADPSGPCSPADVDIAVQVADTAAGHNTSIRLKFTSLDLAACTLAITPDSLALRITSGSDVIWSSDDCPNALLAREITVRKETATVYEFDWDGFRSTATCDKPGKVAVAGGYWAEAALIGGDIHKGYFDIT